MRTHETEALLASAAWLRRRSAGARGRAGGRLRRGRRLLPLGHSHGGQPTPLLRWSGYAEGTTPAGMPVAVALSVGTQTSVNRRPCLSCGNLSGSGELCVPHADIHFKSLVGRIKAYWTTDGSTMTVQLYGSSANARAFTLALRGTWHGDSSWPTTRATCLSTLPSTDSTTGAIRCPEHRS